MADFMFPVCLAVSEALIGGEQLVDSEDDSVYIWWSKEFGNFSRMVDLNIIVKVKLEQSLRSRVEMGIALCNVSIHKTVSEIDLVDDLSCLGRPGKAEGSRGVIVFQSPSKALVNQTSRSSVPSTANFWKAELDRCPFRAQIMRASLHIR